MLVVTISAVNVVIVAPKVTNVAVFVATYVVFAAVSVYTNATSPDNSLILTSYYVYIPLIFPIASHKPGISAHYAYKVAISPLIITTAATVPTISTPSKLPKVAQIAVIYLFASSISSSYSLFLSLTF